MKLHEMVFLFPGNKDYKIPCEWSHTGVVGSGDMEVLVRGAYLDGSVGVKVTTPVRGYDEVWEKVLRRFVGESGLGNVTIDINDNNSTPFVAAMRLKQAAIELGEGVDAS
ncbi:MAG: malonate decarboxylase acyl carrier protein [Treponema sp.]|nr:malonate decarboxylase acyl carrier protein [Treponema sp.]